MAATEFQSLKKKALKNIAFGRNQKIFSGNVIAWCVDLDEKIRYGHFKSKKNKNNNFAGGLGSENFIHC